MFEDIRKKELDNAKKMVCPKCESVMADVGCMTIAIPGKPALRFCSKCYSEWMLANIPEFKQKEYAVFDLSQGKE